MDNSMQGGPHAHNANHHIYDPALGPANGTALTSVEPQEQPVASGSAPGVNPDGTPTKRRPGRPKGSTKKNLLAGEALPAKIKRPVGRPRKDGLPAGSIGPARVKKERPTQQQVMQLPYPPPGYPPIAYGYSISAPPVQLPPPAMFQIDPSLEQGTNDWPELSRTNPNAFLNTLLISLAAPNPVSSAGPTVEEAFKSHLVSLAPNPQQMQPIPSLYSILKTFWLPSSPAYFSLTASASTARTPSEHRFLYWDPQPLVFNGIACPSCSAPLVNKGRISSGPVKIYDIERPFFIVGCEYVCRSPVCVAATSPEGRKFASTDPSILRSLPVRLKDEFPARLLHGDAEIGTGPAIWNWKAMGVSTGLWNLVLGALRAGLRREVILGLVWAVQHGVPDLPPDAGPQIQAQDGQHQDEDDKMEDDDPEEEEEDEVARQTDANETQTLSSTNFTDAYGDAWKENAATTTTDSPPKHAPAPPATPQPQAGPSQAQMPQAAPGYNPYTAYPFTPYAYLPHHVLNGQIVPMNAGQMGQTPPSVGPATPNGTSVEGASTSKRSPRHCCKCGSQECKGKGGRAFCMNQCQDCGKLECKGRNSRRPDKTCSEGWQ